ncbi:MAG: helix-turn-helix domain-containing protein [Candidatus Diapherotrites archaeon]
MGKGNFKLADIAVFHQDCFASETTRKFPEIKLEQVSNINVLSAKKNRINYQLFWKVNGPSKTALENYFSYLKRFPNVNKVEIINRRGLENLALIRVNALSSINDRLLKKGAIYDKPVEVTEGFEIHSLISTNPKNLKRLLSELEEFGEVKILKIKKLKTETDSGQLTEKQLTALKHALAHGYYEWPKKATLNDLAEITGIPRRTFHERLRKAESKIFPKMIIELINDKKI